MDRENPPQITIPFAEPLAFGLKDEAFQQGFEALLQEFHRLYRTTGEPWTGIVKFIQRTGAFVPLVLSQLYFIQNGQQVFVVGPVMQQLLRMTSLEDVDLAELRVPYKSFYMALPDCGVSLYGSRTGAVLPVAGAYVTHSELPTGGFALFFVVWAPPPPGKQMRDGGDIAVNFSLQCAGSLHDGVDAAQSKITADMPDYPPELLVQMCDVVVRLAVGLCLYLTTPQAEVQRTEQHAMPRAARRRVRETESTAAFRSPQIVTVLAPTTERTVTPAQLAEMRSPVRRHWVRGHWHTYWVGARGQQTRSMRWILPHIRGAEGQEMILRRLYKTGDG